MLASHKNISRETVNGFERFLMEKVDKNYGCKMLNNRRVPLIIKKLKDIIDKVPKLKDTIDNFPFIIDSIEANND